MGFIEKLVHKSSLGFIGRLIHSLIYVKKLVNICFLGLIYVNWFRYNVHNSYWVLYQLDFTIFFWFMPHTIFAHISSMGFITIYNYIYFMDSNYTWFSYISILNFCHILISNLKKLNLKFIGHHYTSLLRIASNLWFQNLPLDFIRFRFKIL